MGNCRRHLLPFLQRTPGPAALALDAPEETLNQFNNNLSFVCLFIYFSVPSCRRYLGRLQVFVVRFRRKPHRLKNKTRFRNTRKKLDFNRFQLDCSRFQQDFTMFCGSLPLQTCCGCRGRRRCVGGRPAEVLWFRRCQWSLWTERSPSRGLYWPRSLRL